ncbi:unnamed protein product [Echinostoma caproni]|uniref:CC2-LZ domain-containing protein n=1 Tax=Echinostoma caproni TaxID=27848 RepID=A0A183ALQ0_9TREM|nr:unnamed protein product [Echinostoma caproni]
MSKDACSTRELVMNGTEEISLPLVAAETLEWIQEVERAYQKQSTIDLENKLFLKRSIQDEETQTNVCFPTLQEDLDLQESENAMGCLCSALTRLMEEINIPSEFGRAQGESLGRTIKIPSNGPSPGMLSASNLYAVVRDFRRISKLVHAQQNDISSLQFKVEQMIFMKKETEGEMEESKKKWLQNECDFGNEIKRLEEENIKQQMALQKLHEHINANDIGVMSLRKHIEKLKTIKAEFESYKAALKRLIDDFESLKNKVASIPHLGDRITSLRAQLEDSQRELKRIEQNAQTREMENRNLEEKNAYWQQKHENLIQRMRQLLEQKSKQEQTLTDAENTIESLRSAAIENYEKVEKSHARCSQLQDMVAQLQKKQEQTAGAELKATSSMQQMAKQVEEYKHQLQLLVQYPDLNGPLRTTITETPLSNHFAHPLNLPGLQVPYHKPRSD